MLPTLAHRALYASFDRVPSPKGAATHIERFAGTLFNTYAGGILHVLGDPELPSYQKEGDVEIVRFDVECANFLERAIGYGRNLTSVLDAQRDTLELCHFRDPWSGIPILDRPHRYATIYEVNGLPSIELPNTYPLLSPQTLDKIRQAEKHCWTHADAIVTPSRTIADNLVRLGAAAERIHVVPNGAEPSTVRPLLPEEAPPQYLIYFGALQPWQGVDTLLRAFARLADLSELRLVICSSSHRRMAKPYARLAEKLEIADRIVWKHGLGRAELARWVSHARASIAPLSECARNIEQGCAPLKILESMALGTPVVASDIPAVREIVSDERLGRLVHADRPAELARALRLVLEYPDAAREMGLRGRIHLEENFTWSQSVEKLRSIYDLMRRPARAEGNA